MLRCIVQPTDGSLNRSPITWIGIPVSPERIQNPAAPKLVDVSDFFCSGGFLFLFFFSVRGLGKGRSGGGRIFTEKRERGGLYKEGTGGGTGLGGGGLWGGGARTRLLRTGFFPPIFESSY